VYYPLRVGRMNIEPDIRGEDPSSERWIQYYHDARVRRRARGPELRTRVKLRRYRNRQRAMIISGFLAVGAVAAIFYAVLIHGV
jgi:hypothetical protein